MNKGNAKSTVAKAKALEVKMAQDIKKKKARMELQKSAPQAYKEMIRERGYRRMEKESGEKVQRFRSKEGSAALRTLNDSAQRAFSRREIK